MIEAAMRVAHFNFIELTLSSFLTNTITYAKSVDPDEMAHQSHLIRLFTVCHSVNDPRLATMDVFRLRNGRDGFRKSGGKRIHSIVQKGHENVFVQSRRRGCRRFVVNRRRRIPSTRRTPPISDEQSLPSHMLRLGVELRPQRWEASAVTTSLSRPPKKIKTMIQLHVTFYAATLRNLFDRQNVI